MDHHKCYYYYLYLRGTQNFQHFGGLMMKETSWNGHLQT